ncbi:MAG: glutamate--tRNA ligase family protein [Myxococcota bacterium]|jgi:glutamyl-Q tRNA(Asp) synthetase|nr:glutamate--tRNA ligase family protein [Myxococcota bacterium]
MSPRAVARFAPSTTGPAHPGTLLAGLLCWLDARSRGAEVWLRFEDLDPQRCRPEYLDAMREALDWLGLDWDGEERQSHGGAAHGEVLDALARRDLLYPCSCSRASLAGETVRAPDGSARYPGTCRARRLPSEAEGGWRGCSEALRLRLPSGRIDLQDESGADLSEDPAEAYGDPVVRRRDGAVAYHLASVVDDQRIGVTRIVRGRDLAPSSAVQVAIGRLLAHPEPSYRHHLLLLEERGGKLAKFHGAVGFDTLREHYRGPELCGLLAHACGLSAAPVPLAPQDLVPGFAWAQIRHEDRCLTWDGRALGLGD